MQAVSALMNNLVNLEQQAIQPAAAQRTANPTGKASTSQRQEKASTGHDETVIDLQIKQAQWLWLELEAIYPNRWIKAVGDAVFENQHGTKKLSPIAKRWLSSVSKFKREDIALGLEYAVAQRFKYMPSLSDFISCCEEAKRKRVADEAYQAQQTCIKEKRLLEKQKPTVEAQLISLCSQHDAYAIMNMKDACEDVEWRVADLLFGDINDG